MNKEKNHPKLLLHILLKLFIMKYHKTPLKRIFYYFFEV